MRIQHNIMAMNAYRNYNNNTSALSKNLEKLSSGYKINRAGDDAAGLAISEKMRAQITGLNAAQKNVKDGISLVKTAEGAMQEIQDMLNRMDYLATQSANGTYDNEVDRANLQKEVTSLKSEINRIADSANFNGIKLLDGSLSGKGGSAAVSSIKFENATTGKTTAVAGVYTGDAALSGTIANTEKDGSMVEYTFTYKESADGAAKSLKINFTLSTDSDGNKVLLSNSGKEYSIADWDADGATETDIGNALQKELSSSKLSGMFDIANGSTQPAFTAKEKGDAGAVMVSMKEHMVTSAGVTSAGDLTSADVTTAAVNEDPTLAAAGVTAFDGTNAKDAIFEVNGKKFVLAAAGTDVSGLDKSVTVLTGTAFTADHASVIQQKTGLSVSNNGGTLTFKAGKGTAGAGGLTLQIGDTADDYNQMKVVVGDMHTKALGIDGLDIGDQDGAASAIDTIRTAINNVSSVRGDLGAIQNRLEHTQNNLSVMAENIQDAESTIRDTDVAEEMMSYVKNNILVQSAQAMLAQANQVPQGVLQLLG